MFFQNTAVHHNEDSCFARFLGGSFVDYVFLHPDRRNFQLNGLIHNLFDIFRTPENIYDIDLLRNIFFRDIK